MTVLAQDQPLAQVPWSISIIGAGPVGLALAAHLLHNGFPTSQLSIFEAEVSAHTRATLGGTLDLRPQSGLRLIDEAGLRQQFDKLARPEGEEIRIFNEKLDRLFEHAPFKNRSAVSVREGIAGDHAATAAGNPEIDRSDLRNLLLNAVTPHNDIQWNHKVSHIDAASRTIHFVNGRTHSSDLIVGADGAWSKARRALPSHAKLPIYTGRSFFEFHLSPDNPAGKGPREWTGEGLCQIIGDNGKIVMFQKNSARGGLIRAYAVAVMDEKELHDGGKFSPQVMADSKSAKETLVQHFLEDEGVKSDWSPAILDAISQSDAESDAFPSFTARPFYYIPADNLQWETHAGLTLCGDAAHLMSPFSGEGVNQGFVDCLSLVEELKKVASQSSKASDALFTAQQAYEAEMVARVRRHCVESQANLELACPEDAQVRPHASQNWVKRIESFMDDFVPPVQAQA